MIGQLIGSLTGLATSIIDGKTQIKLTEAEIKKKQLTGEIDWDLEAMRATENSWKDEWITFLIIVPLLGSPLIKWEQSTLFTPLTLGPGVSSCWVTVNSTEVEL